MERSARRSVVLPARPTRPDAAVLAPPAIPSLIFKMWESGCEGRAPSEARAWLSDGTALEVAAATHEGVSVKLPASYRLRLGETLFVSLGDARRLVGPVPVTVMALEPGVDGHDSAVLRFEAMGVPRRRQLASLLLSWPVSARAAALEASGLETRRIQDPQRVLTLLSMLEGEEAPGLVRLAGDLADYTGTRVGGLELDVADDLPLHWTVEGPLPEPPFVLDLGAYEFLYEVPVARARQLPAGGLATPLPEEVVRRPIGQRWLRAASPDAPLEVRLDALGERPLRRASGMRLAFGLEPGDAVQPGQRFSVMLGGGPRAIAGSVEVESVWPSPSQDERLCTARFTPRTEADQTRWELTRERLHHPHTRRAGTWAASLWELYDKSGYFQLSGKTSAHFTPLRQAFALATRRLDTAPELGCQVAWPTRARVEAALSALMVYAGTAMIYQVARRRDEASPVAARQMLREVNLHAFEQLRRDPAFDWTLVYVQEGGARWSHLAYQTFTEAQLPTGLTCVLRFRAMEALRSAPVVLAPGGMEVGPPSAEERALFLAMLPKLRPAPYLEALDLVPERFDLAQVRRRWTRAGFARERTLFVAREHHRPLAMAVVESAQDALHLFGLLDGVRLFPLAVGAERAYSALLAAARGWYRERGKESFVVFFEGESFDAAFQPGLHDLGAANLMAFPRLLLPDFLEHLWAITAPHKRGH